MKNLDKVTLIRLALMTLFTVGICYVWNSFDLLTILVSSIIANIIVPTREELISKDKKNSDDR